MFNDDTLYVNFFAGPGCGKSTMSGGLFYRLKRRGINCEYIQEYAKDKTWSEDRQTLLCQPYVTGKQYYRSTRLLNKVNVAVTDSPIITGLLYQGIGCNKNWERWLLDVFSEFNNLNILLVRNPNDHPYNPKGRRQTEEESMLLDNEIKDILDKEKIEYHIVEMSAVDWETWDDPGLDKVYKLVMERINSTKNLQ